MRRLLKILIFLALLIGAGFWFIISSETRSTSFVNWLTSDDSYTLEADVTFGPGERDRIDYYMATDSDDAKPLIVFIHGGGWNRGDKNMYTFFAEGLTARGYDVALPNYRLYPEIKYPEFLPDNARAIAAIHKKFPTRYLVLIGHSAGAYNALSMVFKPNYLEQEGVYACYTVRGVVSLASPTGAYPVENEPTLSIFPERMQGGDSLLNLTEQPLPPLMLVNGDEDTAVHHGNASKLGEKLAGRDIASVKIYEGADHVDPVSQFSTLGFLEGSIKDDVVAFIENLPEDEGDGFCK